MKPARSKDLVTAAALALAALLGGFLCLRAGGVLGTSWTDGARRFGTETERCVRHAVWDLPERASALGEAADPALAPGGGLIVFTSGTRGLNSELYVAELAGGEPRATRPLAELNTPADELAPAFGDGALYFASDRPGGAGGLDLWRSAFVEGAFDPPEPVGPGLNSAADETDPAPLPDSGGLLFATNRARSDFDLYAAVADADGFFECTPLAALASTAEERGPTLASDPRSLVFASDRAGSFDLYRSRRFDGEWSAPELLAELSSEGAERDPVLTDDGFTLWFARTSAEGSSALFRARSRELLQIPPPAVTLAQWLTLAALVLLALLAQLAKRWGALDILYKCFLVSLLVHLLLMLYLRTVIPEERSYDTGREDGPAFRVRVAPPEPASPEQAGDAAGLTAPLSPTRERWVAEARPFAAPAAELAVPTSEAAPAPAREGTLARVEPVPASVAVARPKEELERYDEEAADLTVEAAEAAGLPQAATAREPTRLAGAVALPVAVRPGEAVLAPAAAARGALVQGVARAPVPVPSADAEPALAQPQESFARAAGSAPELSLPVTSARAPLERGASSPAREETEAPRTAATPLRAAGQGLPDASRSAPSWPAAEPPRLVGAPPAGAAAARPELRAPAGPAAPAPSASLAFEAGAGLAAEPAPLPSARDGGPSRTERDPPRSHGPAPAPSQATLAFESASAARTAGAPAPAPLATEHSSPGVESRLRAPSAAPAPSAPSSSPLFDAIAGLGAARTPERPEATAPERAPAAGRPAPEPLLPAPAPRIAEAAASATLPDAPDDAPPRLAHTPYENRFGAQKLRALEEFGGTPETERAVAAGLAYLARIQGDDGAWGQRSDAHSKYLDVRIGKSALALLAFLGAGHVPGGDTEYSAVAERAVSFLLDAQDSATGHFGRSCSYGHGIATYALAECYALTRSTRLRAPLEHAVAEILRHQSTRDDARFSGGWGYYFADGHVWNDDEWPRTSVTAWQVMALESARLGGLAVPDRTFEAARTFLLATWDARAQAFRYDHDPERLGSGYPILPASTPAALFALSLLGVDPADDALGPARRFILARAPDGYRYTGDDDFVRRARGNPYFWYYATLALFRVGGAQWERWNAALQETLLPAQAEEGSWRPLDTYAEYAGDADEERTYTTSMCVLSLEVYYRYVTPLLRVR